MRVWRSVALFCLVAGVAGVAVGSELLTGSGILTADTRRVESFSSIKADIPLDLYVTVGTEPSVAVYFDDNLCSSIITKVDNGELTISTTPNWKTTTKGRVEVTIPAVDMISVLGMGDAYVHVLTAKTLKVVHEGTGTVRLDGKTKEIEVVSAGSGDLLGRDLIADKVSAESRGSGLIEVFARTDFAGVTFSSGDIDYYGRPEYRIEQPSTEGAIRRR